MKLKSFIRFVGIMDCIACFFSLCVFTFQLLYYTIWREFQYDTSLVKNYHYIVDYVMQDLFCYTTIPISIFRLTRAIFFALMWRNRQVMKKRKQYYIARLVTGFLIFLFKSTNIVLIYLFAPDLLYPNGTNLDMNEEDYEILYLCVCATFIVILFIIDMVQCRFVRRYSLKPLMQEESQANLNKTMSYERNTPMK